VSGGWLPEAWIPRPATRPSGRPSRTRTDTIRPESRRGISAMKSRSGSPNKALVFLCRAALVVFLFLPSCASVSLQDGIPLPKAGAERPTWRAGDRWLYTWTAGTAKGVKRSEALGVRDVGGVQYNVLQVDAAHLYYTAELHWAAYIVESRVMARATPPQPWFAWPLEVGKRWQYQGVYEERERKDPMRDSYRVVGVESVTVPAGTFQAFKIVREVDAAVVDQYWYAPNVRWYVKWIGRRGADEFQELLQEYVPAAQAGGAPAPSADRPAATGAGRPRP